VEKALTPAATIFVHRKLLQIYQSAANNKIRTVLKFRKIQAYM
jgi:hypothetical protein